jgi:hypothetical protein
MPNWERNWLGGGVLFVVLLVIASIFYGSQPGLGASPAELVSFFHGDRTQILIASVIFCFAFLELIWFGAAVSSVLRDANLGGWAGAAIASSAALGALLFLRMAIRAALAFSIVGAGTLAVAPALSDFAFVLTVLMAFPTAMFVMATAFGLWRAEIISQRFFAVGVAAVILTLLGGTTWASDGVWAPDGAYQLISQLVAYAWIAVISGVLYMRSPATATAPDRAAVPSGP